MIQIEIVGRGSEYYFKKEDASDFDKESYISENGEDYGDWDEDDMDMFISLETGIQIYVYEEDNNKDFDIEDCFASDSPTKIKMSDGVSDWRTYTNADDDDAVIIWGHSGVIGFSMTFENEKDFDINKLEISGFSMPEMEGNGVERFFAGLTYNGNDPDDEEPNFQPKYGYWDPSYFLPT